MEHADDAHTTSAVTLAWIMVSYAYGGHVLDLFDTNYF